MLLLKFQVHLWVWGHRDWSPPSFVSQISLIPTRGGGDWLWPPYTEALQSFETLRHTWIRFMSKSLRTIYLQLVNPDVLWTCNVCFKPCCLASLFSSSKKWSSVMFFWLLNCQSNFLNFYMFVSYDIYCQSASAVHSIWFRISKSEIKNILCNQT